VAGYGRGRGLRAYNERAFAATSIDRLLCLIAVTHRMALPGICNRETIKLMRDLIFAQGYICACGDDAAALVSGERLIFPEFISDVAGALKFLQSIEVASVHGRRLACPARTGV